MNGLTSNHQNIPEAAQQLIAAHVNTFEKLEVMVTVLGGRRPAWTLDEIAEATRISTTRLRPHLDALRACGLLRSIPGRSYRFVFEPSSAELAEGAAALHGAYHRDRGAVIYALREVTRRVRSAER